MDIHNVKVPNLGGIKFTIPCFGSMAFLALRVVDLFGQ